MSIFSKKNIQILFLITILTLLNVRSVWAEPAFGPGKNIECKAIGLISPSRAIECIFAKFGITEEAIQENAKMLNVANYKVPAPQVTVTFTSTDPRPGEELTATATPLNFTNKIGSLYYTWYLQTGDCPPSEENKEKYNTEKEAGKSANKRCNLYEDYDGKYGIVDINDYKVKAMRIYASSGFDHTQASYTDSDGKSSYKAIHGGADQIEKNNHCFFHDTRSGEDYEFKNCFHLFADGKDESDEYVTGDDSYNADEEEYWHTNPEDPDTADTGNTDEANVTGLGANNFTWVYQSGDKVGVVIEGVASSATPYEDSSYKIMFAVPNNTCSELADYEFEAEEESGEPVIEIDPVQWPDCPDGCEFTRTVAFQRAGTTNEKAPFSSYNMRNSTNVVITQTIRLPSRQIIEGEATSDFDYSIDITGGEGSASGSGTSTTTIETTTAPYHYPESDLCNPADTAALVAALSANGYTPNASDVIDLADNRSCCDLSQGEFYIDGIPLCSIIDSQVSAYEANDMDVSREGSLFDLDEDEDGEDEGKDYMNACLMENFLTPAEGGGKYENIDVNLSFSPENPVNDISEGGDNADHINIVSSVENSTKRESLHYEWKVFYGSSPDEDGEDWNPLKKPELVKLGASQTSGAGIPSLKFRANFNDETVEGFSDKDHKYLKVRLDVSEKVASTNTEKDGTRKGNAQVIIPLTSFANKFIVKRAVVDDALEITPGAEICKTAVVDKDNKEAFVDSAVCGVLPNEILAVEANITPESGETLGNYDFLWTLNGVTVPQAYPPGELPGKIVYFPILFEKGTYLNLKLVATSQKTGKKISLSRTFLVAEPSLKIGSTDDSTAYPELLGYYTNLDEKEFPNYSPNQFLAKKGAALNLAIQPATTPPPSSSSTSNTSYENSGLLPDKDDFLPAWYLNDAEIPGESELKISFTPPEDESEESSSENSSSQNSSSENYFPENSSTSTSDDKENGEEIIPTNNKEGGDYNSERINELEKGTRGLEQGYLEKQKNPSFFANRPSLISKAQAFTLNNDNFYISVKGLYTQDLNTKKALNKYWGVQINEFYEKYITLTVYFKTVEELDSEAENAQGANRKILASLISSVPAYFMFLFRIVMTTFVMVSSAWILFSLSPNLKENE